LRRTGDEFVVLIQDHVDRHDLARVAEKILGAVSSPLLIAGKEFHVTASIGVAISPDDGCDMQTLLTNADIAMYRAKAKGKNDYQFYAEKMNDYSFERLHLESALHSAMERNELLLYYPPKSCCCTTRQK
jgi:predicted signal transduction protein with EAL and GGDEF domain